MKILVIDEGFPYPLDSGKRIRSFNLLSRLAKRCELHYLAYGTEDSEGYQAVGQAGMLPIAVPHRVWPQSGPMFYLRLFCNIFSSFPYVITSHYSQIFKRSVEKAVADLNPDIILCEWSPYAIFVQNIAGPIRVLVAHNIEYRIWRRYYQNEKSPFKRWYIAKQATKLQTFERRAFSLVEAATAVSEAEADEIRTINPNLPVQTVENGVDLDYFQPSDLVEVPYRLVFVGAMDWRPNQDAVTYFTHEILPRLLNKCPKVSIMFIGRNPPGYLRKLSSDTEIQVLGRVDDVRPLIASAAVYIVPLRIGGGTRLKILEALAMKKAVVSTSIGAEGLNVTNGRDILLADTPDDFAEEVCHLLENAPLRRRLGEAGHELVQTHYDWDRLAERLGGFLRSLV